MKNKYRQIFILAIWLQGALFASELSTLGNLNVLPNEIIQHIQALLILSSSGQELMAFKDVNTVNKHFFSLYKKACDAVPIIQHFSSNLVPHLTTKEIAEHLNAGNYLKNHESMPVLLSMRCEEFVNNIKDIDLTYSIEDKGTIKCLFFDILKTLDVKSFLKIKPISICYEQIVKDSRYKTMFSQNSFNISRDNIPCINHIFVNPPYGFWSYFYCCSLSNTNSEYIPFLIERTARENNFENTWPQETSKDDIKELIDVKKSIEHKLFYMSLLHKFREKYVDSPIVRFDIFITMFRDSPSGLLNRFKNTSILTKRDCSGRSLKSVI